jgi:hypothetical protein
MQTTFSTQRRLAIASVVQNEAETDLIEDRAKRN